MAYGSNRYTGRRAGRKESERICSRREAKEEALTGVIGEALPRGRRKDTKRWCGGKPGRPHVLEWWPYTLVKHSTFGARWRILLCRRCGKHLDMK